MPVIPTLERWRQEGQRSALTLYLVSRPDCQKKGEGERWGGGGRERKRGEAGKRRRRERGGKGRESGEEKFLTYIIAFGNF